MRAPRTWFLPHDDDVLALLRAQTTTVLSIVERTHAWAQDATTGPTLDALRGLLPEANDLRRDVHTAVKASFSTPLDSEDLFELSERIDVVATACYELVRESGLTHTAPDDGLRGMVAVAASTYTLVVDAIAALPKDLGAELADRAADVGRQAEHAYHQAIASLENEADLRHEVRRRELYRRAEHLNGSISRVARRIWYAVAKTA